MCIGRPDTHPNDTPIGQPLVQQFVQVEGLMRPVEAAYTDVDNGRLQNYIGHKQRFL
ncbi:MAG: hypothetical protein LBU22_04895 [Dysgonamonadaceae bacterium]|nr:hypothetical protein [Dysgonamonadaceae bacterium]